MMKDLMKNGLKFYVKKNIQIVWNDNEQWAEFLCKCNQCVLVFSSSQSPVCKCQFAGGVTVDVIFALLDNDVAFL